MDHLWALLPFLGLLACPLMMGFCVWGMRRMACATPSPEHPTTVTSPEERIAELGGQLSAIQAELATLRATGSASAPARTPDGSATELVAPAAR